MLFIKLGPSLWGRGVRGFLCGVYRNLEAEEERTVTC